MINNTKSVKLTTVLKSEGPKGTQDAHIEDPKDMSVLLQNYHALSGLLGASGLSDNPDQSDCSNAEILGRLNALEMRLEARLDRLEKLIKTAIVHERSENT